MKMNTYIKVLRNKTYVPVLYHKIKYCNSFVCV